MGSSYKNRNAAYNHMIGTLKIKTITSVCPLITEYSNTNTQLRDIIDEYGFPYISTRLLHYIFYSEVEKAFSEGNITKTDYNLLKEIVHDNFSFQNRYDDNMVIAHAYLDDYTSYVSELSNMDAIFSKSKTKITEVFADIIKVNDNGKNIKVVSLKPGLDFSASIYVHKKYYKVLDKLIGQIENIGMQQNKHFGKVYISIDWLQEKEGLSEITNQININLNNEIDFIYSKNSNRARLNYEIFCMTGFCSKWSLNEDIQSQDFIDGVFMYQLLQKEIFSDVNEDDLRSNLKCSNAYMSIENQRSTPTPNSFMVEKLNKKNLKDRTIFGCKRKTNKFIQLKKINGGYSINERRTNVLYTKPLMYNTYMDFIDPDNPTRLKPYKFNIIAPRQTFKGYIEGSVNYIRKLYNLLNSQRIFQLGLFGNLGFGISLIKIDSVEPIKSAKKQMVSEFILKCNSQIKLWNENGVYTTDTKTLLNQICNKYGIDKELEVVNSFKSVGNATILDRKKGIIKNGHQSINAGSVFYIKVKNGTIDLNKIRNIHIGEEIYFGYGEIACYEAEELYNKTLIKVVEDVHLSVDLNSKRIFEMAKFRNALHFNLLFNHIENEARYRKLDDLIKQRKNSRIPKKSLLDLRDKSSIMIDDQTIFDYYKKVYKETKYE